VTCEATRSYRAYEELKDIHATDTRRARLALEELRRAWEAEAASRERMEKARAAYIVANDGSIS